MQQKTTLQNLWAKVVSILLHPVFLPVGVYAFLMFFCPELFFGQQDQTKHWWLVIIAYITITFPLLTVFLLWRMKFISSFQMEGRQERYVPLIASMLFYFWTFMLFHKQFSAHASIQVFLFGLFLNTVFTFMATIFFKISMHATGWGGIIAFAAYLAISTISNSVWLLVAAFMLAGLAGAARLFLKAHTPKQLYTGYAVGAAAQVVACVCIHLLLHKSI